MSTAVAGQDFPLLTVPHVSSVTAKDYSTNRTNVTIGTRENPDGFLRLID